MAQSTCVALGCGRPSHSRGLCTAHDNRLRRLGDPLMHVPVAPRSIDEHDRFWAKVRKTDGCWEWVGAVTSNGYGRFKSGYGRAGNGSARVEWAHRYSYRTFVDPIPEGLHIDHLCRNRRCVRPDHLEPVTNAENLRRGLVNQHKRRQACHRGHLYTPETTRTFGPNGKWRECRVCRRERKKAA